MDGIVFDGAAPSLNFQNVATGPGASGTIVASGIVVNQDAVPASNVLIIAFFKNPSGGIVGVSQTEIDSVPAGGSANFSALYPATSTIDMTKTEVDAYGIRM